jgi:hypothetical protein
LRDRRQRNAEEFLGRLPPPVRSRLAKAMVKAGFNPMEHITDIEEHIAVTDREPYWVLKLKNTQVATERTTSTEAQLVRGFHCTRAICFPDILSERLPMGRRGALKPRSWANGGAGDHGIYFYGNVDQTKDMHKDLWIKVRSASKNTCGIIFYFETFAEVKPLSSGGITAEQPLARAGAVVHMKTSSENRWCVKPELISLKAIFVQPRALEDIADWLG